MFARLLAGCGPVAALWLLYAALTCPLAGCDKRPQVGLHDISGHLPDLQFSLLSDAGRSVTNHTYRGYVVMLFFGFTHCRAACPVVMSRLTALLPRLGDGAKKVRLLFVTLDPERDTPTVLHRYLTAFDSEHVAGLTGNRDDIDALAKRYRIAYRPNEASDDIPHSAAVYVFDRQGRARLLITPDDPIEKIAAGLRRLIG